ncbi:PREDICTED: pentatricopeptide repeat-containing protein At5g03800 [Tarenaya hassleriana]|uniref:pentatricopeptide repeat-containing protein At5g03800 n=1 Tax=Tarenaya hassleriana TaxID=28532 RepID=UPI00053C7796|nr:PREDICTED: pentatricopeptide repeat-containing protein At5g03800 [Tarenaya hassleriana]
MSTVIRPHLLRLPPTTISPPQLSPSPSLSTLSLSGKPQRFFPVFSLPTSLSLSPVALRHSHSSSSSSLFERSNPEDVESLIDGLFYLLRLSVQYHDPELAKAVHGSFLKLQEENTRLGNALISAYLKLGFLRDAFLVFTSLSSPSVVSYTSLISGFARLNREIEAFKLFFGMRREGVQPNEYTFVAILTTCVRISRFSLGLQIHGLIVKSGYFHSVYVGNALMDMYSKLSGFLSDVLRLFDEMPHRDMVSWNTVISSLVREGLYEEAFDLFYAMDPKEAILVDSFTVSTLLTASTDTGESRRGKELHGRAVRIGLKEDLSVNNALIGFYTKCGDIKKVENLFQMMPVRDVVTWTEMITAYMAFGIVDMALEMFESMPERNGVSYNALLAGFCRNGDGLKALKLFVEMVQGGLGMTDFGLTSAVDACGLVTEKKTSEQVHGFCIKSGFASNPFINTALLDMCTRCGRMADAEKMFSQWPSDLDSLKVTTSMLCGYARNGLPEKALSFFLHTMCNEELVLDEVSLTSILAVCGTLGFLEMGCQIHCYALKTGHTSDIVLGNSLIGMYSKCYNSDDAIRVFNGIPRHNVVSWNSLISAYVLQRDGDKGLDSWSRMKREGVKPDTVTLVLVISAYRYTESNLVSSCRDLFLSMKTTYSIEPTSEHYTAFVGVLGHWGFLEEAEETIKSMPFEPEVSVLKALLDSCRVHSNTSIAKRVANLMLSMEPHDPSGYILKSNIYSASGLWHQAEMVREKMREKGFRKHPSRSWIIHQNKVHSFYARDKSHPQEKDIYRGLEILIMECLKAGYEPDTGFVLHEVEEHQKKSFLFYHSAKMAATYGILTSSRGKPVRVVKNVMLCGDCHEFLKYVSVVTKREIVVRDSSGFHHLVSGKCSCRDLW